MKKSTSIILFVVALFLLSYSAICISDRQNAVKNPENYHFGSDAMTGEGGKEYESLETYVSNSNYHIAISGLVSILLLGFIFYSRKKRSKNPQGLDF